MDVQDKNYMKGESPMSVTIQVYYRGVSILITKRDPEMTIRPLIESQIKVIDWLLDEVHALPSWNKSTNEEVASSPVVSQPSKPITVAEYEEKCSKCGSKMGISKKGNPYCLAACWVKK